MKLKARIKITEIKKKTSAEAFKGLQVGDVLEISMTISYTTNYGSGNYATSMSILNERSGHRGSTTQSILARILNYFEYEEMVL